MVALNSSNRKPIRRTGTGDLVVRATNGGRYYHRNQQYSVSALTDSSGGIVERYAYDAYGGLSVFDGSGRSRSVSAEGNRYTYTGREWDSELSLFHFRARMYDTICGRFCSRDPIGYPDGPNGYANYFGIARTDSLGLLMEIDIATGRCADWLFHYFFGTDFHLPQHKIRPWLDNAGVSPKFDDAEAVAMSRALAAGSSCDGGYGMTKTEYTSEQQSFQTSVHFVPLCSSIGPLGRSIVKMKSKCDVWVSCRRCGCDGVRKATSINCIHYWSVKDEFNNPTDHGGPDTRDDIEAYRNCMRDCAWYESLTCDLKCANRHLKHNPYGQPYYIYMSGHQHSFDFVEEPCSE
ncbi:RHS repeat domain-containing protein [Rhodopirellula sp. MGV]|uniref:RHS repeat domain-containing protein n=1 Tax=Rhodopirellula sp. MGV TaxID=2023130 RepID=UPI000B9658A8|nr:RHS repeat-associated core domain-containing protein [Rhodopirellula sp. MGV]OYP36789.1 hypothetical protein CGZ80_06985 [Rhodopirellula sp. MGV]